MATAFIGILVGQATAVAEPAPIPPTEDAEADSITIEAERPSHDVSFSLPPRPERPDPLSYAAIGVSVALAVAFLAAALLVRQRS